MSSSRSEALRGPLLAMQIIVVALIMGAISFGVITVTVLVKPNEWRVEPGIVTLLAGGAAAIAIALSFIVPGFMIASARRRIALGTWKLPGAGVMPDGLAQLGDEGQLVMVYQTALIVGAALCEGPTFFALVAAMIEKAWPALAIAGFCLLMLAIRIPTMGRVENWLDNQRRALEADRMLRP